jgi:hypothetical protein
VIRNRSGNLGIFFFRGVVGPVKAQRPDSMSRNAEAAVAELTGLNTSKGSRKMNIFIRNTDDGAARTARPHSADLSRNAGLAQRRRRKLAGMAALSCAGLLALAACEDEGPAEQMGETIDDSAEEVGEAIEEVGEEAQDAAEN